MSSIFSMKNAIARSLGNLMGIDDAGGCFGGVGGRGELQVRQYLMLGKQGPGEGGGGEITCKKIQNYIFNFHDLLGQGNFSKVYKAHNEITKEVVAIKIVELNSLKSKKLEELLFSEIEILKKLRHNNVLKCHEVFTSNRNCYIITELCNEGDLESKLRTRKTMKETEAENYIRDIFRGLLYLNDNHIVHRDLKIANIFIHNGEAKIADFGFAKATKTKFRDINIGSPIYMSPEGLIDNVYGPKTDIWAFGMLIFELLHGETPFSHCKSENQLKYNMSIPIGWSQLKPQLSNEIKEVMLKCLEVDENKRISAQQMKKLAYFRRGQSLSPQKYLSKDYSLAASFEGKVKHSFSIEPNTSLPFKSENNFYTDGVKNRIRTENELYPKKTSREVSEMMSGRSFQKDSPPAGHQYPTSTLKLPLEQDINRRMSNGKHSSSSNNINSASYSKLNIPTSKVDSSVRNDAILSNSITFKECVNILHYCRLLFKHVVLMKEMNFGDENQSNIFKRWLATILKTLMREINDRRVICEGDNVSAREKKLEEVTSEYIKKYTKELSLDIAKIRLEESIIINYEKISNYFVSVYQMIDQLVEKDTSNTPLLQLAHSIVVICEGTRTLKKCYEDRSYRRIEKFKEIEEFLAMGKSALSMTSYQWHRKKAML